MRHFFANVAGESYRNDDGSDRQTIIASCRVGEPLILDAEPDNPEDGNAVRVFRRDGKQIGYLERGMAARLVDDLSDFSAFVAGVGQGGGPYLGVALMIVVNDGQDAAAVEAYARRVLEGEGRLGDPPTRAAGDSLTRRSRHERCAARMDPDPRRDPTWCPRDLVVAMIPCRVTEVDAPPYAARDWRANFFLAGIAHSIVGGSAWEPTPWRAVQRPAWTALERCGK